MDANDKVAKLHVMVSAIREEFEMALQFHETWKGAFDKGLCTRMSHSYEGNAFLIVRNALRREVLLALMRIWDKHRHDDPIRLTLIRDWLREDQVISELASKRVNDIGLPEEVNEVKADLKLRSQEAIQLIGKYLHSEVLEWMKSVRDTQLAHRQVTPATVPSMELSDTAVEEFFSANSDLVQALLSLVQGVAYDPRDASEVYAFYAKRFWASFGS